jgi:hypothetical protein
MSDVPIISAILPTLKLARWWRWCRWGGRWTWYTKSFSCPPRWCGWCAWACIRRWSGPLVALLPQSTVAETRARPWAVRWCWGLPFTACYGAVDGTSTWQKGPPKQGWPTSMAAETLFCGMPVLSLMTHLTCIVACEFITDGTSHWLEIKQINNFQNYKQRKNLQPQLHLLYQAFMMMMMIYAYGALVAAESWSTWRKVCHLFKKCFSDFLVTSSFLN